MTWSCSGPILKVGLSIRARGGGRGPLLPGLSIRLRAGARSKALLALRAAALVLLVLILFNPVRVQQVKRPGPAPTAVFLLDESRSMSLEHSDQSGDRRSTASLASPKALLRSDRRPRHPEISVSAAT